MSKKRTNQMRKLLVGEVTVDGDAADLSFYDRNMLEKDSRNPEGTKYRKTENGAIKLSYMATPEEQTHPIYDPTLAEDKDTGEDIKFEFKKRKGSDAMMLREHKIDDQTNVKALNRLNGTWRLKQKNVDTSKIMQEY